MILYVHSFFFSKSYSSLHIKTEAKINKTNIVLPKIIPLFRVITFTLWQFFFDIVQKLWGLFSSEFYLFLSFSISNYLNSIWETSRNKHSVSKMTSHGSNKLFSKVLVIFFLTVGQNNFRNIIPLMPKTCFFIKSN